MYMKGGNIRDMSYTIICGQAGGKNPDVSEMTRTIRCVFKHNLLINS